MKFAWLVAGIILFCGGAAFWVIDGGFTPLMVAGMGLLVVAGEGLVIAAEKQDAEEEEEKEVKAMSKELNGK